MGNLFDQTKDEFKLLPLILGKLAGGVLAVACFGTAVWITMRDTGISPAFQSIMFFSGVAGVAIFRLFDKKLKQRSPETEALLKYATDKRMDILSWSLMVLLITIFLIYISIFWR